MKNFLKTLLASTLGVIIGGIFLCLIGLGLLIGIIAGVSEPKKYELKENTVLLLELKGIVNDREQSDPFSLFLDEEPVTAGDIINAIKKAGENENITGIYLKAAFSGIGFANQEAIRKALLEFKSTGKFLVAYGDVYTQEDYYLASTADMVVMNPQGMFDLHGLGTIVQFSKGWYKNMGVNFQVFKVGTFKSAVEPYIADKMSEPNREQVTSFLNDIWGHYLSAVSESRNIPVESLNAYADDFLLFSAPENYLKYNLVDTFMYETEMEQYLKIKTQTDSTKKLTMASVANLKTVAFKEKKKTKDRIAVVYAEGVIQSSGDLLGGSAITSKEYVKVIEKLRKDKTVKAVVLRVNSPGGSAFESDLIWKALVDLKKEKPLIVSMGDVAASGGYYISCMADTIVAEPNTITGSIGIFGILPEGAELAKKLGLAYDDVKTNKHSTMLGAFVAPPLPYLGEFPLPFFTSPLDASEQRMMQAYVERGYDLFLSRCAEGRSKTKAEIDAIGQGRVWTGNQALERGLVDTLGGLDDAIQIAARKAGLNDYIVRSYPEPESFMSKLMKSSANELKVSIIKSIIGKDAYEQRSMLRQFENFDFRMALMPYEVQ